MSKSKTNSYTNYIKRVLMWAAVITSGAVLLFALTTILATDEMASRIDAMYRTGYDAMYSARTMQSGLLRLRRQVASYLMDPTLEESRSTLADIHRWQRQNVASVEDFRSLLSDEQYDELSTELLEIYSLQNEAFATAQSGDTEEALEIYNSKLKALYEHVDTLFEAVLASGFDVLRADAEYAHRANAQINAWGIAFAAGVVALNFGTAWLGGRRIVRRSMEAYRKELLFDFFATHADDVFQIYSFDEDRTTYASENMRRILGVSPDDYLADNSVLNDRIHPDDRRLVDDQYHDRDGKEVSVLEYRYKNPSTGAEQILHTSIYPVSDGEDDTVRFHVLATHDVTADRHAQERLQHALDEAEFANKSRREFLSRMSHEIRTPINAIVGMEKVARDSLNDSEKVARCLEKIDVSATHLTALINDILDMSKIESGRLELVYAPFELDSMLADLEAIMAQRIEDKGQTLEIDTATCARHKIIGDELRLRQVLMNFLSNANKYTPEGAKIRLVVRQTEPRYGFSHMTFSVEDNGRGIPIGEVGKVFLPFERGSAAAERTSGVGLGLPISKHVIDEMGGSIWAESVEGQGSTFSFDVSLGIVEEKQNALAPVDEAATEVHDDAAVPPEPEEKPARLLVVDDNDINMEVARELLAQAGYTVEEAYDGREALEKFESAPPGWYQAVLMDIQMPVMDGRTATQRMRESKERDGTCLPIFAMTADPFVADEASGFDGCFAKPIDADLILGTLEKAIAAKQRADVGDADKSVS